MWGLSDRWSRYALPIAAIALSALVGVVVPLLFGGNQQPSAPWTPPTSTATPTATATATATPLPTASPAASWTPVRTDTPAPTATATAIAETPTPEAAAPEVRAQVAADGLNLRAGPGAASAIVGSADEGDSFVVTGRTQDGTWLRVCCVGEQQVWLSSSYVNLNGTVDGAPVVP